MILSRAFFSLSVILLTQSQGNKALLLGGGVGGGVLCCIGCCVLLSTGINVISRQTFVLLVL